MKNIDPTVITIACCVLATLIFAIILGNVLGGKAQKSKNEQNGQNDSISYQTSLPKPDKQNVKIPTVNAFSVDMTNAVEGVSLSNQTQVARESGNALFVPLKAQNGNMIYSSEKTDSLDVPANTHLTLSRLYQHFQYYADYACGYFKSDFSPYDTNFERIDVQATESALLTEAQSYGFSELLIEFDSSITNDNILYYQSYILNLKLVCPDSLVGVALSKGFCENSESAALISQIMNVADFFTVDLSDVHSPEELEQTLTSLIYLSTRYPCRFIVSYQNEDAFAQIIAVLDKLSVDSFIVLS